MEHIECEDIKGVKYCSDNDCPCTLTEIPPGKGYLYISKQVVDYRRDALTQAELKKKLAPTIQRGENVSISEYEPILMCELGANNRHLDMIVAAEDAEHWWKTHTAPLRETPLTPEYRKEFAKPTPEPSAPTSPEDPQTENSYKIAKNGLTEAKNDENIITQPKPEIDNVSTEDVVSQFAGTPLAEMAAKMEDEDDSSTDPFSATDTAVPSNTLSINWANMNDDVIESPPPPVIHKKKSSKPLIISLILIVLLGIIGGIVFFLYKTMKVEKQITLKQEQIEVEVRNEISIPVEKPIVEEIPEKKEELEKEEKVVEKEVIKNKPVEKPPAILLTQAFFQFNYLFEDNNYYGSIKFNDISTSDGKYKQEVHPKGINKVYHVTGSLSYTNNQIVFFPNGANTEIIWQVQSLNSNEKSAIFYDPKIENRDEAIISLTACETKDCK